MDNLTPEQRRKNMRHIRSKNTGPELLVMNELKRRKVYFARYVDKITGKPDIVFRRKKVVVFIDSDFWHCNPQKFTMPATNVEYWEKKFKRNRERDVYVTENLQKQGWHVLRFWESSIKKDTKQVVDAICNAIGKCNE
jgi:DNA mismatch endonuclease (patch repair protein)